MHWQRCSMKGVGSLVLAIATLTAPRAAAMGFAPTASLTTARQDFAATQLSDGSVLVCGGSTGGRLLSSCERYDPLDPRWQAEGAMAAARRDFTLTALTDGRVVAIGGEGTGGPLNVAEVYDPLTRSWTASGPLTDARQHHATVLLNNGWVLVSGGRGSNGDLASAELWNPARRLFRAAGTLLTARAGHAAFVQASGTVVVLGGARSGVPLATVERYNPAINAWAEIGSLLAPRTDFAAVAVDSERTLVCGGSDSTHQALASCEVFDAASASAQLRASMHVARRGHGLVQIRGDMVWTVGGEGDGGPLRASSEVYNPSLDRWFATGLLATARAGAVARSVNDNRILIAAGRSANGPSASAELFETGVGRWNPINNAPANCYTQASALLSDGRLLVAGGLQDCAAPLLYDRNTDNWVTTGPLTTLIAVRTLTALPDGRALALGMVYPNMTAVDKGEIYDPMTDSWAPTADLAQQRGDQFEASLLQNGRVLVSGGYRFNDIAVAEAYDADLDSWWPAGTMLQGRRLHRSLLLPDGRLLICGGIAGDYWAGNLRTLASCENFDPGSGLWRAAPGLVQNRRGFGLVALGEGALLAAGGPGSASAELFDPSITGWRLTGAPSGSAEQVAAFVLPRGAALLVGRSDAPEVYDRDTEAWWPTNDVGAYGPAGLLPTGEVLVGPQELGVASIYSEGVPPVGLACDVDGDCSGGVCSVEGICCDRRCDGRCESCAVAGAIGVCTAEPDGSDQRAVCAGEGICGGVCNGQRACRFPGAATVCSDGDSCSAGDRCDGTGQCSGTPYVCVLGPCDLAALCDGSGGCSYRWRVPGDRCDDGNRCTLRDQCDGRGTCAGSWDPSCTPVDGGPADRWRSDLTRPDVTRPDAPWTDVVRRDSARPDGTWHDAMRTDSAWFDALRTDTPRRDGARPDGVAPGDRGDSDATAADHAPRDAAISWEDAAGRDRTIAIDGPRRDAAGGFDLAPPEDAAMEDAFGRERRHRRDAASDLVFVATGGCQCGSTALPPPTGLAFVLLCMLARWRQRRPPLG